MTHDELSVDIKIEQNGSAVVFRLRGCLDLATSPSVRAALLESANDGKHEIIVDLTQLEFIDSTGLGALIGAHRRATEHGGRVALIVADGPIARLLNITGLIRIFGVYGNLADALADKARLPASI
ncbi:MAG: STAS domain-containing protein [Candidatus Eremiobacteraeota bacterium]|nr:STAS domain-containing protein [Candidatus Eremiobacteraeota bacterium]